MTKKPISLKQVHAGNAADLIGLGGEDIHYQNADGTGNIMLGTTVIAPALTPTLSSMATVARGGAYVSSSFLRVVSLNANCSPGNPSTYTYEVPTSLSNTDQIRVISYDTFIHNQQSSVAANIGMVLSVQEVINH